ncbi:MAG: acyl carrier protein [bacterium]|jgi:acyl carrier protein
MEKKLTKIMAQILGVQENEITPNSSPDNLSEWDSLKHMNLVLGIEQGFNISFDDEDIIQMLSFEIILETIKEKI